MEASTESARPSQFFVKLIDGKTSVLNFTAPDVDALSIKRRVFEASGIPAPSQRLIRSGHQPDDRSVASYGSLNRQQVPNQMKKGPRSKRDLIC